MANWQVISLDTATPQLRAPGTGDGYSFDSGATNLGTWTTSLLTVGTALTASGAVTATKLIPTGNVTAGDGMYLPTTNTLAFSTNGSERVRVTSAGNVGIGTTNPITELQVVGAITLPAGSNRARIASGGSTALDFLFSNADGSNVSLTKMQLILVSDFESSRATLRMGRTHTSSIPSYSFIDDPNTGITGGITADTLGFVTGGTERMRIDSAGLVGIGTTTPATALNISGTTNVSFVGTGSITGTTLDVTAVSSGTLAVGDRVIGVGIDYNTVITALGTGTGGTGTYTINNSQTIGSQSINACSGSANVIRISDTDTGVNSNQPNGALEWFGADASTFGAGVKGYVAVLNESTTPDTAMVFGTSDNIASTQAKERMRITSAGDVGIGTSSPNIGSLTGTVLTINGSAQSNLEMASAGASRARIASSSTDTTFETRVSAPLVFGTNSTERARITAAGSVVAGGSVALATTATDGFLYVPTCAGTPTGVPTAITGMAPIVVNTTNNKLYFYSGGQWRDAGP
jgi:hypothetical protein